MSTRSSSTSKSFEISYASENALSAASYSPLRASSWASLSSARSSRLVCLVCLTCADEPLHAPARMAQISANRGNTRSMADSLAKPQRRRHLRRVRTKPADRVEREVEQAFQQH